MGRFDNKTVFITGSSRGIGKCIKESFLSEGALVVAPDEKELDLSSNKNIITFVNNNDLSKIDIFIHCAGVNKLAGINEISQNDLDQVFQINLFSAINLLQPITNVMKNNGFGRIVLISSLYSIVSRENRIAYSTSKNALTGLAKTLSLELARDNILTNCVAPGYVMTCMTQKNLSFDEITQIENEIPTGRFQTEQEIADLVLFLSSENNKSITGQLIAVDGGFLCK